VQQRATNLLNWQLLNTPRISSVNEEQRFTNVKKPLSRKQKNKQTGEVKKNTNAEFKSFKMFFPPYRLVLIRSNSVIKLSESYPTKVNLTIFLVFITRAH